jgi:hypothetical protein
MYSLALIIFVVSEKKAFEHFPIGSNVNPRNDHWKVLYKLSVFYADRKSKMAATTRHRLTLDPMGKYSNAFFSETANMIKAKLHMNVHWMVLYCGGGHLGFLIGIKNIKFIEDLPMIIPEQFGFNCPSGFRDN